MWEVLAGGLGLAGGVIAGLVYAVKYYRLEGEHKVLVVQNEKVLKEYDRAVKEAGEALGRVERELNEVKERESRQREEIRELLATCASPDVIHERLNRLFPVQEAGEDSGEGD